MLSALLLLGATVPSGSQYRQLPRLSPPAVLEVSRHSTERAGMTCAAAVGPPRQARSTQTPQSGLVGENVIISIEGSAFCFSCLALGLHDAAFVVTARKDGGTAGQEVERGRGRVTRVTVREVVGEEGEARPVQLSLRREGTVGRGTFGLVERVVVVRGQAAGAELAMKTVAVRRRDSRELRILRLAITILQVILKPNILYDVQPAASPEHCKSAVFLLLALPGRGGQPA